MTVKKIKEILKGYDDLENCMFRYIKWTKQFDITFVQALLIYEDNLRVFYNNTSIDIPLKEVAACMRKGV